MYGFMASSIAALKQSPGRQQRWIEGAAIRIRPHGTLCVLCSQGMEEGRRGGGGGGGRPERLNGGGRQLTLQRRPGLGGNLRMRRQFVKREAEEQGLRGLRAREGVGKGERGQRPPVNEIRFPI